VRLHGRVRRELRVGGADLGVVAVDLDLLRVGDAAGLAVGGVEDGLDAVEELGLASLEDVLLTHEGSVPFGSGGFLGVRSSGDPRAHGSHRRGSVRRVPA
jgi:hypothetical protein